MVATLMTRMLPASLGTQPQLGFHFPIAIISTSKTGTRQTNQNLSAFATAVKTSQRLDSIPFLELSAWVLGLYTSVPSFDKSPISLVNCSRQTS
jgi:hypothetical protein